MTFTASGPLDNIPAIDINGNIQTMSLKLSPPIVRLILHAIKTLLLTAVCLEIKYFLSIYNLFQSIRRSHPLPQRQLIFGKISY